MPSSSSAFETSSDIDTHTTFDTNTLSDASLFNTHLIHMSVCIKNMHTQTQLTHKFSAIVIYADAHMHSEHLSTPHHTRHLKWPSTPTRALCINFTPRPLSSSSAGFLSVAVPLPEGGSQQTPPHSYVSPHHAPYFLSPCPCHFSFPVISVKVWFIGCLSGVLLSNNEHVVL